jgi:hypothetical protein
MGGTIRPLAMAVPVGEGSIIRQQSAREKRQLCIALSGSFLAGFGGLVIATLS